MRTSMLARLGTLTTALFVSGVAFAGNPHFIKNLTSLSLDGADLVVSFKEAGLPSGAVETVELKVQEAITYECVNGGGKNPSASNKHTFATSQETSGQFTANQNGEILGSLELFPASAASLGFACPNGQTVTLVSVSYSDIELVDETSGATLDENGTETFTNPDAPPVR
jgi:hypothetical protein